MRFARRLIPVGVAPRLASVVRAVLLLAAVSLSPCLKPAPSSASAATGSNDAPQVPPSAGSLQPGARLASRVGWARRLTDREARSLTPEKVLGGADGWRPDRVRQTDASRRR